MPRCTAAALLSLYTLGAILTASHVGATPEASPKVFGMDFHKLVPRNTPLANRLRRRQKTVTTDITNGQIAYIINVTIGTPPQPFSLQLDTGSSDLWVPGANSDPCVQDPTFCQQYGAYDEAKSSTFQPVGQSGAFTISYQDNSGVQGDYFNDTLAIGKTGITDMTMAVAQQASRPFGIMGIGYIAGESSAGPQSPNNTYPNVISQLQDQGYINTLAYSLWLNDLNSNTGSILFGGIDSDKFKSNLIVLPIQSSGSSSYTDFTVALSSVSFTDASGKTAFSQDNLAVPVILDSGTTITYVPDSILSPIMSGVGAVNNAQLGGPVVPCSLGASPSTLNFGFGGNGGPTIHVPINEMVIPIYDNNGNQLTLHGNPICNFGLDSGGTGPYLFGDTFLRSAYVVYDLTSNQIGIAETNFNATSSNPIAISDSNIPSATATATGAAVTQTFTGHPQQTVAATRNGGSQATGGLPSATFNLGQKSSAFTPGPPRVKAITVVTGLVCVVSLFFGGSMVFML